MNQQSDAATSFGELFLQFASMASHVFWVYDLLPEEHVVYVSPSFERVWGRPGSELYARHGLWMDCIHPDDRPAVTQRYNDWLNSIAESYQMEFRIQRPDGGVRWIFDHGRRIVDAAGVTVRVIGIAEDVTERKLAEAALRAERDRLSLISSASPGVLHSFRVTPDGRMSFPFASAKIRDVYGIEAASLFDDAQPIHDRLHPDDVARVRESTSYSRKTLTPWNQEFRVLHPTRGEIWIESHSMPRREEDGSTIWHGFLTDVTARKRAERQQQHSQKLEALGTLAGGIAHDFNNLLLSIRGNTRLAMADLPDGHEALVSLMEAERATLRATDLVRQILSFSRQSDARRQVVDLHVVIEDALKLLRATLPAMMHIESKFQSDLPAIAVDVTQIHQIIMNLATNAAHAIGDAPGVLEVAVDAVSVRPEEVTAADLHSGHYVRITVSDNGCGMDRTTVERIFDPFFTTKPPGQGTGLGLSVVHGIVRSHDGAVRVYSQPGKGTTFRIYLPVGGRAAMDDASEAGAEARGAGEHVMYIDDEESLVFLGKRVLEKLGYRVTGFSDPSRALLAFQREPHEFDVVVTDLSMPGMSGFHLAGAMLKTRPDLPIVMTTGYVRPDDKEAARKSGVRELILKPNTIDELGKALDRVLRQIREG